MLLHFFRSKSLFWTMWYKVLGSEDCLKAYSIFISEKNCCLLHSHLNHEVDMFVCQCICFCLPFPQLWSQHPSLPPGSPPTLSPQLPDEVSSMWAHVPPPRPLTSHILLGTIVFSEEDRFATFMGKGRFLTSSTRLYVKKVGTWRFQGPSHRTLERIQPRGMGPRRASCKHVWGLTPVSPEADYLWSQLQEPVNSFAFFVCLFRLLCCGLRSPTIRRFPTGKYSTKQM